VKQERCREGRAGKSKEKESGNDAGKESNFLEKKNPKKFLKRQKFGGKKRNYFAK